MMQGDPNAIELQNRRKFAESSYVTRSASEEVVDYFSQLNRVKMDLLEKYLNGKTLDLCCATGEHLVGNAGRCELGIGVDYSLPFLSKARKEAEKNTDQRLNFVLGNAKALPFASNSFNSIYSYSALYYIPHVEEAIIEAGRIMKPGGYAIFDLGNRMSLNTFVCLAYPETAHPCYISISLMKKAIRKANLEIVEHRAFQLLPLWGNRPAWLRPLLLPIWKRIMGKRISKDMTLDEMLCRLPILHRLSFRHIFVCRKRSAC